MKRKNERRPPVLPFLLGASLLLSLLSPDSIYASAVDRSKFRTCSQTSFCRRHRNQKPRRSFAVDPSSIRFVFSDGTTDGTDGDDDSAPSEKADTPEEESGFWKSLLNTVRGEKGDSSPDPHFRGPPPALLATVRHVSPLGESKTLDLSIHLHSNGISRVRIKESPDVKFSPRWTSDELVLNVEEMEGAPGVVLLEGGEELEGYVSNLGREFVKDDYLGLKYGEMVLVMRLDPFEVHLFGERNALPFISLNSDQWMHFENRREDKSGHKTTSRVDKVVDEAKEADRHGGKEIVGYWEDGLAIYADGSREEKVSAEEEVLVDDMSADEEGLWEEKFSSHMDSKPHGPTSVGVDISFPMSTHTFGIPEHASNTVLKTTTGEGAHYSDPYRLYNLDVFEYELDETMSLYGSIPLIVGHGTQGTSGVFYFNPSETWVDILDDTHSHWISESGILDIFLLPGPSVQHFYSQYKSLTSSTPLPPLFALGYHQCRWNYRDQKDVYDVHAKFEELDYPYDVLWLDIEHTDGKRYFTWDDNLFPTPKEMIDHLASQGRHMVTIVDPHIKRDNNYYVHKEATQKGYYVKDKDGNKDYDGWCWPGSSSYPDFTSEEVRKWWSTLFQYDKYIGSTPNLHTWNDMNEPSVFNGPEVSMQKDLLNLGGIEHREWHNLYGMLFHQASQEGLVERNDPPNLRGFVLSRAFFAGSQRYGAIWTGDNVAEWSHLQISSPMLLSLNVAGLTFVGADVGGFFQDTTAELMTRWMQAGAFQPFFRGHAHHDVKRREPWMFGDETMRRLRKSAMERYALLPYWYTVFYEGWMTGMPVMRTMWMEFPHIESLFTTDDQYLIGNALLVKPITTQHTIRTVVAFPAESHWYDVETLQRIAFPFEHNDHQVHHISVKAPLDKIPVYQRGGTVIPRRLRLRRSSKMMYNDPYTLYIALDHSKQAQGSLYMDDEATLNYQNGQHCIANILADVRGDTGTILNIVNSTLSDEWVQEEKNNRMIERIVIMGLEVQPSAIAIQQETIHFEYMEENNVLVIRKPSVSAMEDWNMSVFF